MSVRDELEIDAEPFAVYVTATGSVDELREAMRAGALSVEAAWAVHVMDAAIDRHGTQSGLEKLRGYFAEFDADALTSRANVMRTKCGGGTGLHC